MSIRFDNRVAIVTGAGNGLGRSHALALAARGAKVVVNDFGGARDGTGGSSEAALKVVEEIVAAGGEAIANGADVSSREQVDAMVASAMEKWGRVDILINNAGILRDKTFAKMSLDDFWKVVDVHLMGSVNCTKAVWEIMREQNYGRILFTASASGIYGNFGQANYGAAKAAMIGLMNVLHLEGASKNIRVNTLAPAAATRMTEELMPPQMLEMMKPEMISPGVLYLVSDDAPSKVIMEAAAGVYAQTRIYQTRGAYLKPADNTPEGVAASWAKITSPEGQREVSGAGEQSANFLALAAEAQGVQLPPRG
ncbi:SDR family oxidoreductase [Camelimonas abortus]|uniref:SDR family oxidoreductase n=1 Tax=Camelimonas abortus TaxID=1017184 RepID=A0ABV7LH70_9HYPH